MSRDQQLAAEVVDGRLVISIGVDALMTIVQDAPLSTPVPPVVAPDALAASIGRRMIESFDAPRISDPDYVAEAPIIRAIRDAQSLAVEAGDPGAEDVA